MEKYFVNVISKQTIDGEIQSSVFEGELIISHNGVLNYQVSYLNNDKQMASMVLIFEDDESITVKLNDGSLTGVFMLSLNEETEGCYSFNNSKLLLNFFLKKINKKAIDISLEYDIFTNGNLLSNNVLEIEVKKC